jgi:two-component system LytT family sensor kinase
MPAPPLINPDNGASFLVSIMDGRRVILYWLFLFTIPFYFFNCYYLIPRYLNRDRYLSYFIWIISGLLFSVLLGNFIFTLSIKEIPFFIWPPFIFPFLLLFATGAAFEVVLELKNQRTLQEEINRKRTEAELSYLKSQINPHFLFNTLNNIYSLAEKKSDDAGRSILLLANLMRYMLYECNIGTIPLKRELTHLEDYIALQKLRISNRSNISLSFKVLGEIDDIHIEPLIFISFIENAFKYGISYVSESFIYVTLIREKSTLHFTVVNSKVKRTENLAKDSLHHGIGLFNTKRRLELLYPQRHELRVEETADRHEVFLSIELGC